MDIEEMRPADDWPRGVIPAIQDWLRTPEESRLRLRQDLDLYGISCHPHGFLHSRKA